uniref:G_PROTEIN_RECEP_F1_2 domain-containing protein n=1 Tax=Globodera pallida TaxID=36090 RepID=A0A183BTK4_GLOPA
MDANAKTPAVELPQIQRSAAELVEILIYSLCLLVGGPLNLLSFRKLLTAQLSRSSARATFSSSQQITLLKFHLNIADLVTMYTFNSRFHISQLQFRFIYTLSQIIWMISYQWHSGDLLCRLCKFFHTFGFYLNSFIVACFAIDRFLGTRNLNNPSGTLVAHRRVKRMLAVAWGLATFLSIPQCFIFRVFEPSELPNFRQCTPIWTILGYELDIKLGLMQGDWQDEAKNERRRELIEQFEEVLKWERAYNLAHLLFVFWIPSLIIAVSYTSILATLNSFSVVPPSIRLSGASFRHRRSANNDKNKKMTENPECGSKGEGPDDGWTIGGREGKGGERKRRKSNGGMERRVGALAAQTIAKARQNAKRQAALILAAYLTFWSPYNLLAIINAFAPKEGSVRDIFSITLPFLNSLIVVNPIVNPLIYGVFEFGRKS